MAFKKRPNPAAIYWPKLTPGTLQRRYKRFLADVKLKDGQTVTAHCPNSGSMQGCSEIGKPVYLSYHDNPKRKLKYTWELIRMPTSLVGVNTLIPNRLVHKSIAAGQIGRLSEYEQITPEAKTGMGSRLDFLLTNKDNRKCYLEVKNCTLVDHNTALFPDAVTSRGLKHLYELQRLSAAGCRCVMFYLVQRMDADVFKPAKHIDPAYAQELRRAVRKGIEVMVYDVKIDLKSIRLNRKLPYQL